MNAIEPHAFRLIRAPRRDAEAAFLAIVDKIQRRDGCDRVRALQAACDENPDAYSRYVEAFG